MRQIKHEMQSTKERICKLQGIPVNIKVNKGRNRFLDYKGCVKDIFPSVFTFQTEAEILSFSICDVVTKNIKFFPQKSI